MEVASSLLELTEIIEGLQRQVHALEIVTVRALVEMDAMKPGLLDEVAGPVIFQGRPDTDFDAHLGQVDEQVSRLLVWARQYRGDPD
jgi:hypothetical protein